MGIEVCGNCRFFKMMASMDDEAGYCRRNPPTIVGVGLGKSSSVDVQELIYEKTWFPIIGQGEWCGEFSRAD